MHAIVHTYRSLLADVARLTGFSEIRGSIDDLHWCVYDAPKLEKHLLECVENGLAVELDRFPTELQRLALGSVSDPMLMRYLRQLLLFCYKATVTHDEQTTRDTFDKYLSTNDAVGLFGNSLSGSNPYILDCARRHVQSVLYAFRERDIVPFHGPGASTTPKGPWSRWYGQIERLYPYSDYFSLYYNAESCPDVDSWTDECIVADLVAVPKDSRGPRLICIHPAEAIWLQQGLRVGLERAIAKRRSSYGPWPCGHIRFDDQDCNGRIALLSSRSRKFATLDLSEASDRLSDVLVQVLFGRKYRYFGCSRAQKCHVRDARLGIPDFDINSYAPMGNATTFPVQSLCFWAICVASMQHHGFHQPNAVFVFGDDIVVPTECAQFIIDDLECFGLLVNRRKSFYKGMFRESCGVDAFNGVNVTPVRWRTGLNAEGLLGLQSLCDMAMRLRLAGYTEAAITAYHIAHLRCEAICGGRLFTTNNPDHGGIAEYCELHSNVWRDAFWHRDTQQFASPIWRLQDVQPHEGRTNGWYHVLESICSLERVGRSNVPSRDVSRRQLPVRGWIPVL